MSELVTANIIKTQLYHFGGVKVMSWGAHNFMGGENFLEFKVQGYKLKGYVRITLNGLDLYNIEFKNRNKKLMQLLTNVYSEDLVDWIDHVVETNNGEYTDKQKEIIKKQNSFL